MTFLAPLALVAGLAAAAIVVVLHLITTRRPPAAPLPTARFVPVSEARAVSRASRPADLVLLALRLLAVLCIGAAFARPVLDAAGPSVRSVILLERSGAVADPAAAREAARAALTAGGALVVFDGTAREVPVDSLDAGAPDAAGHASVSPALLAGVRAAARIARGADSVRLVIVSPLTTASMDAATRSIRASWPGGIELVQVRAAADSAATAPPRLVTTLADDPLAPAISRVRLEAAAREVRIVRRAAELADSGWVRSAARVLVVWPLVGSEAVAPEGIHVTGRPAATLVTPLARLPLSPAGLVLARWSDGTPAVVQRSEGEGCIREVGIGIPLAGDITLRAAFAPLLARIVAPCGGVAAAPLPDSALGWLRGTGGAAPAQGLAATAPVDSPLAAWLLGAALLALAVEWRLRRRERA